VLQCVAACCSVLPCALHFAVSTHSSSGNFPVLQVFGGAIHSSFLKESSFFKHNYHQFLFSLLMCEWYVCVGWGGECRVGWGLWGRIVGMYYMSASLHTHTATHCNTLQLHPYLRKYTHCNTLHYTATTSLLAYIHTLQHTATHCITLQLHPYLPTYTHCNILQHYTATHCNYIPTSLHTQKTYINTLQHTALHCITLQLHPYFSTYINCNIMQ